MKILVLGADGYLGWPTCLHFSIRGHEVHALDSCVKRRLLFDLGRNTLVHVHGFQDRISAWTSMTKKKIEGWECSLIGSYARLSKILHTIRPDVIVHYAEQPSAPFSMMNAASAVYTQENNVLGTLNLMFAVKEECPEAHIIKLGTMGEYGTPGIVIEEGWLNITHRGKTARVLYPKSPGSFYHASKIHDSTNLEFGCRAWGLRVSDLNQGVVYGFSTPETEKHSYLGTMLYYDDIFGTVLNRFIHQAAVGHPLTVYGRGGQTRGFINIIDTMKCVEIAALNPADPGEFRVFNQFTETYSVSALAGVVEKAATALGMEVKRENIENPRVEAESHYYDAVNSGLKALGHRPTRLTIDMVKEMLRVTVENKGRIDTKAIRPSVKWREKGWEDPCAVAPSVL